jgi:hypothetical protein
LLVQYGFTNETNGNLATSVNYDNVALTIVSAGGVDEPTAASFEFTADFEAADAGAGTIGDSWKAYGAGVNPDGSERYSYGAPFDAPNGANISNIASGDEGAEQGTQYLTVFNDYANGDHGSSALVAISVFREFTIGADDSGTYRFSVDARLPSDGALASPTTGTIFVKRLDPANGYATTVLGEIDVATLTTSWQTLTIDFEVDGSTQAEQLLQFGFSNTATSYNPSAVIYDNVTVSRAAQ